MFDALWGGERLGRGVDERTGSVHVTQGSRTVETLARENTENKERAAPRSPRFIYLSGSACCDLTSNYTA